VIVAEVASPSASGRHSGTTSSVTSVAALRITTASFAPNDFSPPIASTACRGQGSNGSEASACPCWRSAAKSHFGANEAVVMRQCRNRRDRARLPNAATGLMEEATSATITAVRAFLSRR